MRIEEPNYDEVVDQAQIVITPMYMQIVWVRREMGKGKRSDRVIPQSQTEDNGVIN